MELGICICACTKRGQFYLATVLAVFAVVFVVFVAVSDVLVGVMLDIFFFIIYIIVLLFGISSRSLYRASIFLSILYNCEYSCCFLFYTISSQFVSLVDLFLLKLEVPFKLFVLLVWIWPLLLVFTYSKHFNWGFKDVELSVLLIRLYEKHMVVTGPFFVVSLLFSLSAL